MIWQRTFWRVVVAGGMLLGTLGTAFGQAGTFADEPLDLSRQQSSTVVAGDQAAAPGAPAAAEGETSAPAPAAAEQEYTVKRGDTLSQIAKRFLGNPSLYREIVRLNADRYPSLMKNPNLILVGWTLRLPGAAAETAAPTPAATVAAGERAAGETGVTPVAPAGPTTTRAPAATAAVPAGTTTAASAATPGGPLLGPGQRVLHIGDSHTVGVYGSTIDEAMRGTGAQVRTIGVAGSSPRWWYNGTVTKCGYYARDEKGKVDRPADWRTPRATPSLPDMIKEYKPTVLVVSLGANLFGASEATVKAETQRIIDTAKAAGCTLVWVGPPRARESVKSIPAQDRLCETIKATVGNQGTFVDSRPFTKYPASGGDGLHYWGTEGTRTAKAWAGSVLGAIQTSGPKK
ncbi:MAG: LysM peptidoglycan-binding domain-containing protein [Candidatus Riflebacteria bacterium]|nr:LysM peptidoglycan-binding domain-containing protein [Candidatus Riflebacteria bacterium]